MLRMLLGQRMHHSTLTSRDQPCLGRAAACRGHARRRLHQADMPTSQSNSFGRPLYKRTGTPGRQAALHSSSSNANGGLHHCIPFCCEATAQAPWHTARQGGPPACLHMPTLLRWARSCPQLGSCRHPCVPAERQYGRRAAAAAASTHTHTRSVLSSGGSLHWQRIRLGASLCLAIRPWPW